jgi:hypothetical protein
MAPAVALVSALALAACGDDEGANEDYAEFCDAELALEQTANGDDQEAIVAAGEALLAASPDDETRAKVQSTLDAFMALEGPPDDAFNEAYGEVLAVVKDNCGFNEVDLVGKEYSFEGAPDEVDAGPTVFTFANEGEEYHEVAIMKRVDGDETPVMDLLMMDEEEAMALVQPVGGAFAAPGSTGYTAIDLEPGKYVMVCFLPEGSTEEAFQEMMTSGEEPEGDPHAMHGMTAEFEVTA